MSKVKHAVHFSSDKQDWETPDWLFEKAAKRWGPFWLDAACTPENSKCVRGLYAGALEAPWAEVNWCNPPYGREIGKWIAKAYEESTKGCRVVCLIPARTDTVYWHEYVTKAAEIVFLKGRVKFKGAENGAPFPSALVVFEGEGKETQVKHEDWR